MARKMDALAIIAAAAAEAGIDVPDFNRFDEARREADSVALYVERPDKFRETECRQCSRRFATNYASVAMCSDTCRREYLRSIGIEWDLSKTQEQRWGGRIPLVIGPDALAVVKSALEMG